MRSVPATNGTARKVGWGVLYLVAGWLVAYFFLHFGGLDFYPRASFSRMVDGTADKPYVGRMLVPAIIRTIDQSSPEFVKSAVRSVYGSPYFLPDFYGLPPNQPFPFAPTVYLILAVAMYAGVAFGGRAVFIALYGGGGTEANIVGLLYVIAVPLWFRYASYIYDPMTILLATWILYAAIRANVWLCCALFVLACINKETAVLSLPVIVYGLYRLKHRYVALGVGVAMTIAAVFIQAYRTGHFDSNGGAWMEPHWRHQTDLISTYTASFLYAVLVMGVLLWLGFSAARQKPAILKIGFCFTFVPLFLASIPYGFVDEIRALYDSYPYVMMLAMPTLLAMLGIREFAGKAKAPDNSPT